MLTLMSLIFCSLLTSVILYNLDSLLLPQIGVAFLLLLLLIVLAIGVIRHWASNNFYLTRTQMFFVCFLAFLLGLAAFLVGWFDGKNKFHFKPLSFV